MKNESKTEKIGGMIHRITGSWSAAVHSLLLYLEKAGFMYSPKFFGTDELGREMLSYIEGETLDYSDRVLPITDEQLILVAKLLRQYHDSTLSFDFTRKEWFFPPREPIEVMCHNDFAPYNCVFKDGKPIGIIDFDTASPGPRIWDIAYSVYRFVPLSSSKNEIQAGSINDQIRRINIFCDAYGLLDKIDLIDVIIDRVLALIAYINNEAQKGNAQIEQNIEEGHLEFYQRDLVYIQTNYQKIKEMLI